MLDHPSTLEDDGTVVVQNVRNSLPVHTAEHTITQASLFVERGFAMTGKQAQEKQFYCGV